MMMNEMDAQVKLEGARLAANRAFPRLIPYAPTVEYESLPNMPHVAGRFDARSQSVKVNAAKAVPLEHAQLSGLIALERARGYLASPAGQSFIDQFPLPDAHRIWWDKTYLPPSVTAPTEQGARDRILKSTMLSRLLVGDEFPDGAPPVTPEQLAVGQLFSSYAAGGKVVK